MQILAFTVLRNITVPGDPYKSEIEESKKQVETAAIFPDDPGVIRNVRQRFYGSLKTKLTIRRDRDAGERNTVDGDPLNSPVDGH